MNYAFLFISEKKIYCCSDCTILRCGKIKFETDVLCFVRWKRYYKHREINDMKEEKKSRNTGVGAD